MLIGDLLFKDTSNDAYSVPFDRRSGDGTFLVDVLQIGGTTTGTLTITVETRNRIDSTWSSAGSFTAITAVGAASKQISTGLKELLRFKASVSGGSADCFFRVAFLPPVWA